jgi:hypothetical protein
MKLKDYQILALHATEKPDYGAFYRRVCRWYSKNFSTPLETVLNDLPEHDVLRHYFEDHYYELEQRAQSNDEAKKAYEELKNRILVDEKEIEEIEVEDEEWEKEELSKIKQEETGGEGESPPEWND